MTFSLDDVTLENFLKKVTYSSDSSPGNKLIVSNGVFVQSIIWLKIEQELRALRMRLK